MDIICADCHRLTEVVFDHATGDTICSECGLVLESHSVDESSEWRTFANDDSNNNDDPNRVGMSHNPLLDDFTILKTDITNSKETKSTHMMNTRTIYRATMSANKSTHTLTDAYDRLAVISERLGVSRKILDRGCEIFKNVFYNDNVKTCRGRNLDAVLSGCLLVACQQENFPRTIKEVCAVVKDCNVSKKEVMRAKNLITKQLNDQGGDAMTGLGRTIRACDIVKRFCYNLKINDLKVTKAALEIAEKCEEQVDVRRSPVSIAAAVIYIIVQLWGLGAGLKSIASATEVAEGTIKHTYKDMYPHLSKIIPTSYADQASINKLCVP